MSSLSGGMNLVPVTEPSGVLSDVRQAYRARYDSQFIRYEELHFQEPAAWRARTLDGRVYYFADDDHMGGAPYSYVYPLTRVVDVYGNTVHYYWITDPSRVDSPRLDRIVYTDHPTAFSGTPDFDGHAEVRFSWSGPRTCPGSSVPSGASESYRRGRGFAERDGAYRLDAITVGVKTSPSDSTFETRRTIDLDYAEPCLDTTGNARYLTSIQETATSPEGLQTTLPAVTFDYGAYEKNYDATGEYPVPVGAVNADTLSFGTRSDGPMLDAMLIDFNGDGRVDRLETYQAGDCELRWYRNTGDGWAVEAPAGLALPRLPWEDGVMNSTEDCSLLGQRTFFSNGYSDCPEGGSILNYRFLDVDADGLPDLVTALSHDVGWYVPDGVSQEPLDFNDAQPVEPEDEQSGSGNGQCVSSARVSHEYQGRYVWNWYKNIGDGQFDPPLDGPGNVILSPVELEPNGASSSLGSPHAGWSSQYHTISDIDGDGYPDAVTLCTVLDTGCVNGEDWLVYRGQGDGTFAEPPNTWQGMPGVTAVSSSATPFPNPALQESHTVGLATLVDMNADGLADWISTLADRSDPNDHSVRVHHNVGRGFSDISFAPVLTEHYWHDALTPLTGTSFSKYTNLVEGGGDYVAGDAAAWLRVLDYDEDGRLDLYNRWYWPDPEETTYPQLHVGQGDGTARRGHFLNSGEVDLTQHIDVPGDADNHWYLSNDLLDIDGDGDTEAIIGYGPCQQSSGNCYHLREHQQNDPGSALRLLRSIDNGTGLVTTVSYAAHNDPSVRGTGVDPADGMPSHVKVVSSITSEETLPTGWTSTPAATTTYKYGAPAWTQDHVGRWGFRGFDFVETYTPSGSLIVDHFDYDLDWSGRLGERVSYAGMTTESPTASIERYVWGKYLVLVDESEGVLPERTLTWVCNAGATYDQCWPTNFGVETTTYRGLGSTTFGQVIAWAPTYRHSRKQQTYTDGDRYTYIGYKSIFEHGAYLIREKSRKLQERRNGTWFVFSKDYSYWSADGRFLVRRAEAGESPDRTRHWTYGHDPETGLRTWARKPVGYPDGVRSDFAYDDLKLFVAETTNELGHVVSTTYDPATGALLERRGPNTKACGTGCEAREGSRTTIDGFGRPLETWVAVDDTTLGYQDELIKTWSYFDSQIPQRVREQSRLDYGGSDWITVDTQFDAFGRTKRVTQDPAGIDTQTTYDYDESGNLIRFETPDPRGGTGVVEFRYAYDSLNRPTGMRLPNSGGIAPSPDTPDWASGIGLDLSYDGYTVERTEVIHDAAQGGAASRVRTTSDPFGRLVKVEEWDGAAWVAWSYEYNAADALTRVTDPEGLVTSITYDMVGNRRTITRGARTWSYDYDLNGNLVTETVPYPSGALATDYTTSIVYDELDRPVSKLVGPRALTTAQLTEYATGPGQYTTFTYDQGDNGIGRLAAVAGPTVATSFEYDALGRVLSETRGFDLSQELDDFLGSGETLADSRTSTFAYNALGQVEQADVGSTALSYAYEPARGLPESVTWRRPGQPPIMWIDELLAAVSYTPSGHIAGRLNGTTFPGACLYQGWTRDHLGRTLINEVLSVCGGSSTPTAILREQTSYYDSGDVKGLDVHRELTGTRPLVQARTFSFTYDDRHQLIGAYDDEPTDTAYTSSFAYTTSGRLSVATVTLGDILEGYSDARERAVTYVYPDPSDPADDGYDPEAVRQLIDIGDSSTVLAYDYDRAGNLISRIDAEASGAEHTFAYDGEDQQREATAPSGRRELYYYDHAGQRTLAVQITGSQIDRIRFWNGATEIWYDAQGDQLQSWVHVSLAGQTVARIEDGTTFEYQYSNDLGHLMGTVAEDGYTLDVAYIYSPFGEVLTDIGSTSDHLRRFNGKEFDTVSGLSYYGFRYYDPVSLTWTQADPRYRFAPDLAHDKPRKLALYAFSLQNPLRFLDPDGLDTFELRVVVIVDHSANPIIADEAANVAVSKLDDVGADVKVTKELQVVEDLSTVGGKAPKGEIRIVLGTPEQIGDLVKSAEKVGGSRRAQEVEHHLSRDQGNGAGATISGAGTSYIVSDSVAEADINQAVPLGNLEAHEGAHSLGGKHTTEENELMNKEKVPATEDADFNADNKENIREGIERRGRRVKE